MYPVLLSELHFEDAITYCLITEVVVLPVLLPPLGLLFALILNLLILLVPVVLPIAMAVLLSAYIRVNRCLSGKFCLVVSVLIVVIILRIVEDAFIIHVDH